MKDDGDAGDELGLVTVEQALEMLPKSIEARVFRRAARALNKNYSDGRSMMVLKSDILEILKETENWRRGTKSRVKRAQRVRSPSSGRARSSGRPEERIRPQATGAEKAKALLAKRNREAAEKREKEFPTVKKRRLKPRG